MKEFSSHITLWIDVTRHYCDRCGTDITCELGAVIGTINDGLTRRVNVQLGTTYLSWELCVGCLDKVEGLLSENGLRFDSQRTPIPASPKHPQKAG